MTPSDLVYLEIYKGCLKVGCAEFIAKNAAIDGLKKYKNNQFTKPSKLILDCISEAKKLILKKIKTNK